MITYEEEKEIEILDEVDVLMAGVGVSGCAAAVGAEAAAKTMLIEKRGFYKV